MFEKAEASPELIRFMNQWKGQPHEPYMKDKARHWQDVLGIDKDFFWDTLKMSDTERRNAFESKPDIAEKYHAIWERLRDNGWRRLQDRDGAWHWACMFEHLVRKTTYRSFEPTEAEQDRWEKEYYGDDVFVPEVNE